MKYERIERSLEETIVFCNQLKWNLSTNERDLFLGKMSVEQYLNDHIYQKVKAQQFIDFHFKKEEEFKKGQWCWLWDDKFHFGFLRKYHKSNPGLVYKHIDYIGGDWKNCMSIEEFRERLKEYL